MNTLRVALAQINPTVGNFEGNIEKIILAMEDARQSGADIVTFPELALCGYPPEDLLLKPKFLRDNREALEEVVQQSSDITALVGFADISDDNVYNAAALISNKRLVSIYHKVELPNYGVFDEKRYFSSGSECLVFELRGFRTAVNICEDIWIRRAIPEHCAINNGTDIVLNISSSPFHAGKLDIRRNILSGFARRVKAYVCYNNLVGGQDELVFDGGSVIISPQGELIARAKRFEEDLLVTDIQRDLNHRKRQYWQPEGVIDDRIVISPAREVSENQERITPSYARELDRIEEIYSALVLGTGDYIRKNGFKKVVIGLSGGIDSSLTACIAVDALGAENVIGVTMPSQHTSNETRSDAEILAGNLNISFLSIPIQSIFSAYVDALKEPFQTGEPGVEFENLQARIRGNILMALSNRFNWLVLTTGNKSETAVGYCTLYGDMAGGFAVIKDVPKTLVYELAEYVNRTSEIIPYSIIQRPPTAELRPNQKDEDSLPPYPILDPILRAYVEEDKSLTEIIACGFDVETVRDVICMVDRSEYKRRQAPPGVKITPKAFGRDRRLPITNRYFKNAR